MDSVTQYRKADIVVFGTSLSNRRRSGTAQKHEFGPIGSFFRATEQELCDEDGPPSLPSHGFTTSSTSSDSIASSATPSDYHLESILSLYPVQDDSSEDWCPSVESSPRTSTEDLSTPNALGSCHGKERTERQPSISSASSSIYTPTRMCVRGKMFFVCVRGDGASSTMLDRGAEGEVLDIRMKT